jgi:hypothetical protein
MLSPRSQCSRSGGRRLSDSSGRAPPPVSLQIPAAGSWAASKRRASSPMGSPPSSWRPLQSPPSQQQQQQQHAGIGGSASRLQTAPDAAASSSLRSQLQAMRTGQLPWHGKWRAALFGASRPPSGGAAGAGADSGSQPWTPSSPPSTARESWRPFTSSQQRVLCDFMAEGAEVMTQPTASAARQLLWEASDALLSPCSLFDAGDVAVLQRMMLELASASREQAAALQQAFFESSKVSVSVCSDHWVFTAHLPESRTTSPPRLYHSSWHASPPGAASSHFSLRTCRLCKTLHSPVSDSLPAEQQGFVWQRAHVCTHATHSCLVCALLRVEAGSIEAWSGRPVTWSTWLIYPGRPQGLLKALGLGQHTPICLRWVAPHTSVLEMSGCIPAQGCQAQQWQPGKHVSVAHTQECCLCLSVTTLAPAGAGLRSKQRHRLLSATRQQPEHGHPPTQALPPPAAARQHTMPTPSTCRRCPRLRTCLWPPHVASLGSTAAAAGPQTMVAHW